MAEQSNGDASNGGPVQPQEMTHVQLFMSSNNDHDDNQAAIIVNDNNSKTNEHFDRLQDILYNLSDIEIVVNISDFNNLIKRDKNNNNYNNIEFFLKIMGDLNKYLIENNKQIKNEIPAIMETQKFEPNDNEKSQLCKETKIWDYLNQSIKSYIDVIDTFLTLKNEFLFIFYYLTFKPNNISQIESDMLQSIEASLRGNNNFNNSDINEDSKQENKENKENENNNDESKNSGDNGDVIASMMSMKCMSKVKSQLCGVEYMEKLYASAEMLQDNIESKTNEFNQAKTACEEKINQMESELTNLINEYNNKNSKKEECYTKWLNNSENEQCKSEYQNLETQLLEMSKTIDNKNEAFTKYQNDSMARLSTNFNDLQAMMTQYNNKFDEIELLRNKLSLKDSEIKLFIVAIENAFQYTKTIAVKCEQFEKILQVLFELVTRHMTEELTIESYFNIKQLGLSQFVKILNDNNILTIKQLQTQFGTIAKLTKFLESKMNRKITLIEKNRLKPMFKLKL